jgi:hypothetical protein
MKLLMIHRSLSAAMAGASGLSNGGNIRLPLALGRVILVCGRLSLARMRCSQCTR